MKEILRKKLFLLIVFETRSQPKAQADPELLILLLSAEIIRLHHVLAFSFFACVCVYSMCACICACMFESKCGYVGGGVRG